MIDKSLKICLVIIDSLRADHLSCYGYKKGTSPNIDSISQNSVTFNNAVSQSNWTYPSLYSLISGRYQSAHCVAWFSQKINERFVTLPEVLQKYGYHTAVFSNFKSLVNPAAFGSHFKERKDIDLSEDTLKFMAEWFKNNRRSFSIFHTADYVHRPYHADKQYVDIFYEEGYGGLKFHHILNTLTSPPIPGMGAARKNASIKLSTGTKILTKKQLSYLIACYDAGIYYVDKFIGRLYELFQKENEDYLFIITADHGESFFEHNFYGHGLGVYEELVRVPLIINMNKGRKVVVDEPVQQIDLYPTLLEILGLNSEIKNLDGVSLVPFISNDKEKSNNRVAISEGYPFISLRKGSYKLISTHFRLEKYKGIFKILRFNLLNKNIRRFLFIIFALFSPDKLYNLYDDPKEKKNIKDEDKIAYNQLRERLEAIFGDTSKSSAAPESFTIDEKIKLQLKSLGYM